MKIISQLLFAAMILVASFSCNKENIADKKIQVLINTAKPPLNKLKLGQHYHGGTIFLVDTAGQHGLIAADEDLYLPWELHHEPATGATDFYYGDSNTTSIINIIGPSKNTAAGACWHYSVGQWKDWYLPSIDEMEDLYEYRYYVPGLDTALGSYWTSTEKTTNAAYVLLFNLGGFSYTQKIESHHVRAISSF